jgi:hypothetical protein
VACAATIASGAALAQSGPTGALNGRVVDQSQAAIPGATVNVVNTATNESRSAVTNGEGVHAVPALPVGTYELTVQLDGFKTVKRQSGFVIADTNGSTRFSIERIRSGIDADRFRSPIERFPTYRIFDLTEWLERH